MAYGSIHVSTDLQTREDLLVAILRCCDEKRLHIDQWFEEIISAGNDLEDRALASVAARPMGAMPGFPAEANGRSSAKE